ncbi:MAG: conjugative transfer protein [Lysobacter sp.]|nr:conjugative transfer protein [Lysobacter sp.]
MFGKSKQDAPKVDGGNAAAKSVNFEISIADVARRSEKRAWAVAFVCIVMSLILAGGYFYMLPLKKIEPYMVMADPYTGAASVAKLEGDYVFKSLTTQEAVQKSNVAHYIIARESFDYVSTSSRDWNLVHLMSSAKIGMGYTSVHDSNNPEAPFNIYGRDRSVRINIVSTTLRTRGTAEAPVYEATVRFQRTLYDKRTGLTRLLDNKTAMMEFVYNNNLVMDDKQRQDNPLGFQVTSYRVDSDATEASPVAPPSVPLPADPMGGVQPVPGQALPGQVLPGQPLPGQPLPGQPLPGQTLPGQPLPAQPLPGQAPVTPQAPQFGAPVTQPVAPQPQQPQPQQPAAQPNGVR